MKTTKRCELGLYASKSVAPPVEGKKADQARASSYLRVDIWSNNPHVRHPSEQGLDERWRGSFSVINDPRRVINYDSWADDWTYVRGLRRSWVRVREDSWQEPMHFSLGRIRIRDDPDGGAPPSRPYS